MTVNQQYLNNYFLNIWSTSNNPSALKDTKSGMQLINKINSGETVIDVGCGTNPFKGLIPNLVGLDPAFEQADIRSTIDNYITDTKYDVAFCLGSINFGDADDIENQIAKIVSLLNPGGRIYWRCNPGRKDHNNVECEQIEFYPWSLNEHVRLAEMFNFKVIEACWEQNNKRIYAEWIMRTTV